MNSSTRNIIDIKAPAEKIYKAIMGPGARLIWLAPGNMTATMHYFDGRVGGGYEMSLYYPATDGTTRGKTRFNEDRFRSRFTELTPYEKIVEVIRFESDHPDFGGEMILEITLTEQTGHTKVVFLFINIPGGIRPEDNIEGTASSLNKLAAYIEKSV